MLLFLGPACNWKIKLTQTNKVRKMNEKAIDAFKTISEVSVELNIPQHVLRFWEKPKIPFALGMIDTFLGGSAWSKRNDVNACPISWLATISKFLSFFLVFLIGPSNT